MQKSAVIEYKHDGHLCPAFPLGLPAPTTRILIPSEWGVSRIRPIARPVFGGFAFTLI